MAVACLTTLRRAACGHGELDREGSWAGRGRGCEHAPPVTLAVLPTVAQARAVANRVFDDDKTFTDAVVDDVVFVAGDVHVRGSLNGKGTLIARGGIELAAVEHEDRDQPVRLDAGTCMSLVALGSVHRFCSKRKSSSRSSWGSSRRRWAAVIVQRSSGTMPPSPL
jgi:hypothetical protein